MKTAQNAYSVDFPPCKIKGKTYRIRYRTLSRRYHVSENNKEIGRFLHSDLALICIINQLTGNQGDELPQKYAALMKKIEKAVELNYQGLPPNDEPIIDPRTIRHLKRA